MSIVARYLAATPASAARYEAATRYLPGGDTRAVVHHRPYPLSMARGQGPYLWDVDGNRYVDCLSNYSSLVHGHLFPPVVAAVRTALELGTAWPALHDRQVELAARLCDRVSSVDLVRFCNSGTEAAMAAVKIARRVTGRPRTLVARTSYHGSYDGLEGGRWGSPGVNVLTAEYGDAASFESVLERHGAEVAGVVVEPVQGRDVVTPPADFLRRVQDAAHRCGALFAVDEVQTLRLAYGGLQSRFEITPDLTIMGKIIGGGFPVGAVGGSASVMAASDPRAENPVALSGTFNGNPVTCAAGIASMDALDHDAIARLDAAGARLGHMIEAAAREHGAALTVSRAGSLLNLHWDEPARPAPGDGRPLAALHLAAMNEGVFFSPEGYMALNTATDDSLLGEVGERLSAAIAATVTELVPSGTT